MSSHFPASLGIIWAFPLPFPRCSVFLVIKIKNQRLNRKIGIRSISSSSTDYFLSNHTTFNQTQTDATVPLNNSNEGKLFIKYIKWNLKMFSRIKMTQDEVILGLHILNIKQILG
jgi:hypothetical protein